MKAILGIIAALAAVAGTLYFLVYRKGGQTDDFESDMDYGYEDTDSSYEVAYKEVQKESSKQTSATNIKERHRDAGEQIKESLDIITEKSVNEEETNKAKLNQIFDDLEEI